jgi:alkanesulfonate monooxygenase SsuD/methylene tetrahydromethanopterin reductase-like flavin-dependent oxidoreductase (luciferase family)
MEFGYYTTCYYPDADVKPASQLYEESIEQLVTAEDAGFTSLSIPEHHFANYLTIPSPLLLAMKAIERTKQVPIITAVVVPNFYDPLRLAGEIALADNLTGGRLQIGLGSGGFKYEFDRFGVPFDERGARFSELVTLLDLLLSEKDVTFEGKFYNIPEPITIMPRSLQTPHSPFWIAALREGGIRWTVSQGHQLMTTPLRDPWEITKSQAEWFLDEKSKLPEDKQDCQHMMVRNLYVSTDRKDLEEKAQLLLENHRRFSTLAYSDSGVHGGMTESAEANITVEEASTNTIFGTPDEVIEQLKAHEELKGIDIIHVNMAFGADQADIIRCIELFGEQVAPEFAPVRA